MYNEEDYLLLSGIQHFKFCRRQWAFIHIEQQWEENLRTVEGNILHEKAHDKFFSEKRGDVIITRSMPVASRELGITGECDIVEFHENKNGIPIIGREGTFLVFPVEYKKGKPKEQNEDILQLTAQALCLEEMLCCDIPNGALYYGETRKRLPVSFTPELRNEVKVLVSEMHQLYERRYTPKAKRTKACNACSLKNLCLPMLEKCKSVKKYILDKLEE